eukprot:6196641-Pleurochrysis_carterae.AAC.3
MPFSSAFDEDSACVTAGQALAECTHWLPMESRSQLFCQCEPLAPSLASTSLPLRLLKVPVPFTSSPFLE